MRRPMLLASVLFLSSFSWIGCAAPAASELEQLRAEVARLRAENERLRPAGPTTAPPVKRRRAAPTTLPATSPVELTVEEMLAAIPPATLYPDDSKKLGGETPRTVQWLDYVASKEFLGRRVRLPLTFRRSQVASDGSITLSVQPGVVAYKDVRLSVTLAEDLSVPESRADDVRKLKEGDRIYLSGTLLSVAFQAGAIQIDLLSPEWVGTEPKKD